MTVVSCARVCARLNIRKATLVFAALVAAFFMCLPVSAQLNTGRVSGAVTDQSGGAIAGAKVTVTEVATGVARNLVSDSAGQYGAPNLNPGIYTIRVEFMGFQTIDRENVQVGVGSDIRVDLTMQPGEQTQTVTVTESLPVINTTNAQTGGTIEQQTLNNLPIAGRNYRWQQAMVPGVSVAPGEGTGNVDANGTTDGHGSNTLVDGVSDQSYFVAEMTFGGTSEGGDTTVLPLDAIQEVNLVVNPKAEYGWIPGVTNNVGLKSGTNTMHGNAYAFGRDTALQARNAFASASTPIAYEQFGGTLGGPIKKDKIFYFMGYEGFRESLTSVVTETAPSLAAGGGTSLSIPDAIAFMNANAHPLNTLSLNLAGCNSTNPNITSTSAATVALACTANQYGAPGLWNNPSLGILPNFGHSDNGLAKIDYHINDHHQLNGSYARGYYVENAAANSAAKIAQNYWEEILGVIGQMTRVEEIWTPNSSWLNEARFGLDQQKRPTSRAECSNGQDPFSDSLGTNSTTGNFGGPNYLTQYGLNSGAPGCGFPTIILASPVNAQLGFSNDKSHRETNFQGNDVVSYTRGKHQFKFGTEVRAIDFFGAKATDQQSGVINFGQSGAAAFTSATSLESFLAGVPSSESIRGGVVNRDISEKLIAMFAQDDWRITPKLTLNIGLRGEIATPMTVPTANIGNFDPTSPSGVVAETSAWKTHYNFLPHFGFAWDVTGKGTTTLRAGAGVANGVPTLMNFIAGSGNIDLSAAPTGETLFKLDGSTIVAPGSGKSSIETISPVSNGKIVTSSTIVWPSSNTAATALFPNPVPEQCGNGLAQVAPGNPATINPAPCKMYGVDPNMQYYHYISWNANFQHAFTHSLSVDVGYVGSRSTGLQQLINLNQAPPSNVANPSPTTEQQNGNYYTQFPWFSSITYYANSGSDNFRSLQIALTERPAHGLSFSLAYTLAGNYSTENTLNIHLPQGNIYGGNNYPLHHIAVQGSYNVPGIKAPAQLLNGWTVNGSYVFESSLPYSPLDTKDDFSGAGAVTSGTAGSPWTLYGPADPFNQIFGRAGTMPCFGVSGVTTSSLKSAPCTQVVAGAAATPWSNLPGACIQGATQEASFTSALAGTNQSGSSLEQLALAGCYMVNGSAIVPPAQGTYGTMVPNALRGPGESLVNASVNKTWKINERWSTQFRFEVFNLFNVTQYAGQGVNLGSPNVFGAATATPNVIQGGGASFSGGPRYMQLGLKINF